MYEWNFYLMDDYEYKKTDYLTCFWNSCTLMKTTYFMKAVNVFQK